MSTRSPAASRRPTPTRSSRCRSLPTPPDQGTPLQGLEASCKNPLAPPEVVFHTIDQARGVLRAAKALGVAVQLRSAPDASAYAGVGYLHALGEELGHDLLVDCHEDAGTAMAALRTGCRKLIFSGDEATHGRLLEMAEQLGAAIIHETIPPDGGLMLGPEDDGELRAKAWLSQARADEMTR